MSEPAPVVKMDRVSVGGLEVLFDKDSPEAPPAASSSVQDQAGIGPGSVQESPKKLVHPITVEEAARLLNISTNAVCKRLRKGALVGQKIPGKFKEEWLVEGAGLIEVLKVDFNSVQDSPPDDLATSSSVQDQTDIGPGSVQESPESLTRLVDLVEKQAAKLEAAAGQIGYLQAQLESQSRLLEAKEAEIKLLTDSEHKAGWWVRFSSWFLGKS
ncbi:MAG: helix-turn-helix domain-containing protein [Candidatus Obscuribacterales bacterium]|nr:helix-turn-helix domain-containing protein [Candidatus Obscuribacterales bacterium]